MKEFFKENWPYIAAAISLTGSLLIAIFRNQLATIGDSLVDRNSKVRRYIRIFISLLLSLGIPIFMFIFTSRMPFNQLSVGLMIMSASLFIFNMVVHMVTLMFRHTDNMIYKLQEINELNNQTIEKEKILNEENFKVINFQFDILYRMADAVQDGKVKDLRKEIEEFAKQYRKNDSNNRNQIPST